jgi:ribosome-associated protein
LHPQALLKIAVDVAGEKKALDITVLDIRKLTVVADYFVICTGRSSIHTRAIADEIEQRLTGEGQPAPRKEGFREGNWILMDCGDVVIHIFQEEERIFYNLERLWGDAPVVAVPATV